MSFALLTLIVLAAYVVQSALGFGATVLAFALAAFLYPIEVLLPVLVTLDTLQCAYIATRYRSGVDVGFLFKRIVPLLIVGMPLGMALFHLGDDRALKLIFGLFVITLAGLELRSLYLRRSVSPPLKTLTSSALLIGGGITHGLYGSGGPMVVYVAGREMPQKDRFRSTMSALWVLLNMILVIGFIAGGNYNLTTARMAGLLLLPVVIGVLFGEWIHNRIQPTIFQGLVYAVLMVAGIVLALTA